MINTLIDALTPVLVDLVVSLVGILGALLLSKLRKIAALKHVSDAMEILQGAIVDTVYANQQLLVDDMKAAAKDGKLTPEEIKMLRDRTVEVAKAQVGPSVLNVILAAGIDADEFILNSAEGIIREIKAAEA